MLKNDYTIYRLLFLHRRLSEIIFSDLTVAMESVKLVMDWRVNVINKWPRFTVNIQRFDWR